MGLPDDLKEYKPFDALDVIEIAREVFYALAGAAGLALLVYGFVVIFLSL